MSAYVELVPARVHRFIVAVVPSSCSLPRRLLRGMATCRRSSPAAELAISTPTDSQFLAGDAGVPAPSALSCASAVGSPAAGRMIAHGEPGSSTCGSGPQHNTSGSACFILDASTAAESRDVDRSIALGTRRCSATRIARRRAPAHPLARTAGRGDGFRRAAGLRLSRCCGGSSARTRRARNSPADCRSTRRGNDDREDDHVSGRDPRGPWPADDWHPIEPCRDYVAGFTSLVRRGQVTQGRPHFFAPSTRALAAAARCSEARVASMTPRRVVNRATGAVHRLARTAELVVPSGNDALAY